jgi:SAM-dependent methyltransferase
MDNRMIPTLELFNATLNRGRLETKAESLNFWDQKAVAYKKLQDEGGNNQLHEQIIQAIVSRTGLNKSHRVLDIGCGPGRHSRLLANIAGQVNAFDLAPTMVKLAKEEACRCGLPIETEVLDFDQVDLKAKGWEGRFFLAFASRTPAIHDLESLRKMSSTVKEGFGVLVSSIELTNSLRDPLIKTLAIDSETVRAVRSAYLELNLLWLSGYYPEVRYFYQKWSAKRSLTDATYNLTRFFRIIKDLSPKEKELIAESLRDKAQDDQVLEEIEAKTTLIIWEIPPQITVSVS